MRRGMRRSGSARSTITAAWRSPSRSSGAPCNVIHWSLWARIRATAPSPAASGAGGQRAVAEPCLSLGHVGHDHLGFRGMDWIVRSSSRMMAGRAASPGQPPRRGAGTVPGTLGEVTGHRGQEANVVVPERRLGGVARRRRRRVPGRLATGSVRPRLIWRLRPWRVVTGPPIYPFLVYPSPGISPYGD